MQLETIPPHCVADPRAVTCIAENWGSPATFPVLQKQTLLVFGMTAEERKVCSRTGEKVGESTKEEVTKL